MSPTKTAGGGTMRIIPRSCEGYDPGEARGDRIQVAVVQSLSVTCNTTSHITPSNGHGEEEASIYKKKSQLQSQHLSR